MDQNRGLYETLITEKLDARLGALGVGLEARRSTLHEAEAADRIALHLSCIVERAVASIDKEKRVEVGTALARQLVDIVVGISGADALASERPIEGGQMLQSILGKLPDGTAENIRGTRSDVAAQVEQGFPFLPAGCQMELDPVAEGIVLASIRGAVPSRWTAKVDELRAHANGATAVLLPEFLDATGLDLEDIYTGARSWSDLCQESGLPVLSPGPQENVLRRAVGRLLYIDDERRIDAYQRLMSTDEPPDLQRLTRSEQRLLRMLVATIVDQAVTKETSLATGCAVVWEHPQVRAEVRTLLNVLRDRITHVSLPLTSHPDAPLAVHARYTRIEILSAFGVGEGAKVAPWQTGAYWVKDARADLLAFTLDKTSGHFSPTTRYRDYAISRELIHWESQSVTRADSETGLRYQRHSELGSAILLFARLRSDDRAFYFLGPATYVKHESELPMAVTWRLTYSLPGDLFASFAAAVA